MFRRLATLFKGFLGLFVSNLERQNPEAILEAEKENLRAQIAKYNQGLASHAGLCEHLSTQIKRLEAEEQELRAKTTANLRAGNREVAAQYALRLQTVTQELESNRKQYEESEQTYKELIKARDVSVSAARAKIETLKRSIDDLKIKKAQAELTEMASTMVSTIGGSGDNLNRLQELVEEDRNKAAGRARVARDSMDMSEIQMKDAEAKALADQALADFAAKEGIQLDPTPTDVTLDDSSVASPNKTMGPMADTQG